MAARPPTRVYTSTSTDPAMRRQLMRLIDQTIAESSVCPTCESKVELITVETATTYDAWLACTNPACQRRVKLD